MGKHERFRHPDVTGETDPHKIKKFIDDIDEQVRQAYDRDRIRREQEEGRDNR